MKLSLNQLKVSGNEFKWADDLTSIGAEQIESKIGAQLGAIDEVIKTGSMYKGLIIVKVVEVNDHPDADRLHVCMVDDAGKADNVERNSEGLVQVVCGAPNVHAGMLAVWLPPGSVVPENRDKEPFTLESRDLRGVISIGMLASEKELSLSDNHDGILEIEPEYTVGSDFGDTFNLNDDSVFDIENKMFTHRPDCFGIIGLARELAGIEAKQFTSPDWYKNEPTDLGHGSGLEFEVENRLPDQVVRFSAQAIKDIEVATSPTWLKAALKRQGLRSINNIVDLTNYYMVLTGQPLHAYDYDKVKGLSSNGVKIVIRYPDQNEKLELLSGKTITPTSKSIMIATDQTLIGLGGVMGGVQTEVDSDTRNIILEAANFNMYTSRRTSMELGLFTDAVTRFTKGQSPLQTVRVLAKISQDVITICGGQVASPFIDDKHLEHTVLENQSLFAPVNITAGFINDRLGLSLSPEQIKECLERVEFEVSQENDSLNIKAPFWRTDIEIKEDIVEEVGRLIGFDNLAQSLPKRDITPASKDPLAQTKATIRHKLTRYGANEILSYSFVHAKLLDSANQDKAQAYELSNALRPELQYYRLSLLPSLLEKVQPNLKAGYPEFGLYEIGKAHSQSYIDEQGLPMEAELTAFVVSANDKLNIESSAYYQAKKYLELIYGDNLTYSELNPESDLPSSSIFETSRAAQVSLKDTKEAIGIVGEFKASLKRQLKLPKYCAGFEAMTEKALTPAESSRYKQLSRYPSIVQDLTLKSNATTLYQQIETALKDSLTANTKDSDLIFNLSPVGIYQSEDDKEHKNTTFRLSFESFTRTLTDKEANELVNRALDSLNHELELERI
jgi:phenylalanyl-tRNA synthetase beta chain